MLKACKVSIMIFKTWIVPNFRKLCILVYLCEIHVSLKAHYDNGEMKF